MTTTYRVELPEVSNAMKYRKRHLRFNVPGSKLEMVVKGLQTLQQAAIVQVAGERVPRFEVGYESLGRCPVKVTWVGIDPEQVTEVDPSVLAKVNPETVATVLVEPEVETPPPAEKPTRKAKAKAKAKTKTTRASRPRKSKLPVDPTPVETVAEESAVETVVEVTDLVLEEAPPADTEIPSEDVTE